MFPIMLPITNKIRPTYYILYTKVWNSKFLFGEQNNSSASS